MSNSLIDSFPLVAYECSMDAINIEPTPSVVALVGACNRVIKSGSLISPKDPIIVKKQPINRQSEIMISQMTVIAKPFEVETNL